MILKTVIRKTIYHQPGFQVALTNDGKVIIKGYPIKLTGEVVLEGEWEKDNYSGGRQFSATRIVNLGKTDTIKTLLASNFITGISETKAGWIVDTLGDQVFTVLDAALPVIHGEEPDTVHFRGSEMPADFVLLQCKGIGKIVLPQILESWEKVRINVRSSVLAIQIGMTYYQYSSALTFFGGDAGLCETIINRPYDLSKASGIMWESVERFASCPLSERTVGIVAHSPQRLAAALREVLTLNSWNGNLAALTPSAEEAAINLCGIPDILGILQKSDEWKDFQTFEHEGSQYIMTAEVFRMEQQIALSVADRIRSRACKQVPPAFLTDTAIQAQCPFKLDVTQIDAIRMALTSPFSVITGGPGTGKTTITKVILSILAACGQNDVYLMSPTGNGAVRLEEATGHSAGTQHRVLELFNPNGMGIDEGTVIIDELSMNSTELFYQSLERIEYPVRIILLGDADQLPAVGAGEPLIQLLETKQVPSIRLSVIYRQAERSGIVDAAHAVLRGEYPQNTDDFRVVQISTSEVKASVTEALTELSKSGYNAEDILLMATVKRGPAGVEVVGQVAQSFWNEGGYRIEGTPFRTADRVMMTKNDYQHIRCDGERGRMNGEMGFVYPTATATDNSAWADTAVCTVTFDRSEGSDLIMKRTLENLKLAWAITVHKAQGGQAPAVIDVASPTLKLALRQIIYTAITRAEGCCILFDVDGSLMNYLRNTQRLRRVDLLSKMLSALLDGI